MTEKKLYNTITYGFEKYSDLLLQNISSDWEKLVQTFLRSIDHLTIYSNSERSEFFFETELEQLECQLKQTIGV